MVSPKLGLIIAVCMTTYLTPMMARTAYICIYPQRGVSRSDYESLTAYVPLPPFMTTVGTKQALSTRAWRSVLRRVNWLVRRDDNNDSDGCSQHSVAACMSPSSGLAWCHRDIEGWALDEALGAGTHK
ncbi:hypothetical protein GGR57DRAFT_40863 [Xylariaceae sp. FL1272]|nr:hypothetical protein GGR57DRAFT_40863 [Xylariaceae sp. FL1272]